ncbi:MAG: PspA/IM30 family protein [Candidatus Dormibacteria bacterium]|jgi:phage shock protein A
MPELEIAAAAAVVLILGWRSGVGRRARSIVEQRISHLLDRSENPVEALDLSYQRQREALQSVRRGIAEVVTSQKRLEIQAAQLEQSKQRLEAQARSALQQNREDLARLALTRAQAATTQIGSLQQQIAQMAEQEQRLELTSHQLEARVQSFKTKRDTLSAQYSAARASARIGEALTGISKDVGDVGMAVERAQEKTRDMQARAAAINQLMDTGALGTVGSSDGDDIDRQLRQGITDQSVEAQLKSLRQELLDGPDATLRIGPTGSPGAHSEEGG